MEGVWIKVEALEKLKQQIAELEAERDNFHMEYRMTLLALAALRRKIDDAPVVAWSYTSKISGNEVLTHQPPDRVIEPEQFEIRPLISKEDLQK